MHGFIRNFILQLKLQSLQTGICNEPTFDQPVKFVLVKACLESVEGIVPAESLCGVCFKPARRGPEDADKEVKYFCSTCKKTLKAEEMQWVFGTIPVSCFVQKYHV